MNADPNALYDRLQAFGLDHCFARFSALGLIHLHDLTSLTIQDFSLIGVENLEDRKRLLRLIQILKCEKLKASTRVGSLDGTEKNNDLRPPSSLSSLHASQLTSPTPPTPSHLTSFSKSLSSRESFIPKPSFSSLDKDSLSSLPIKDAGLAKLSHSYLRSSLSSRPSFGNPIPTSLSPPKSLSRSIAHDSTGMRLSPAPSNISQYTSSFLRDRSLSSLPASPKANTQNTNLINASDSNIMKRRESNLSRPLAPRKSITNSQSSLGLNVYGVAAKALDFPLKASVDRRSTLSSDRITVCVRKRPVSERELSRNELDIINVLPPKTVIISAPKVKLDMTRYVENYEFYFDEVFTEMSDNAEIYLKTTKSLIDNVFDKGKATCFVYGQTGSGKTHTILHPTSGLYILAAEDILSKLKEKEHSHLTTYVGFYEIYQGQLYDLFAKKKRIHARENKNHNVCIVGLHEYPVNDMQAFTNLVQQGCQERSTGVTGANSDSSRSHAVLQISLKNQHHKTIGKISFIDLAGSERGAERDEVNKQTKLEGSEINKSLLALKECIRAMDLDSHHLPFRQSKLTQVLKDSFVGNAKTCMIATIAPTHTSCEHTLNTLRYAYRVKELKGSTDDYFGEDHVVDIGHDYNKENQYDMDMDFISNETIPEDAEFTSPFETLHSHKTAQPNIPLKDDKISPKQVHPPASQRILSPTRTLKLISETNLDKKRVVLEEILIKLRADVKRCQNGAQLDSLIDEISQLQRNFEVVSFHGN